MHDRTDEIHEHGFMDHVLVCTNGHESEYVDYVEADGPVVYDTVTSWLCDHGVFWLRAHVAETNCLGLRSADGAVVVIHPRNRWYSDVRPDDVPALLAEVLGPGTSNFGVRPHD